MVRSIFHFDAHLLTVCDIVMCAKMHVGTHIHIPKASCCCAIKAILQISAWIFMSHIMWAALNRTAANIWNGSEPHRLTLASLYTCHTLNPIFWLSNPHQHRLITKIIINIHLSFLNFFSDESRSAARGGNGCEFIQHVCHQTQVLSIWLLH